MILFADDTIAAHLTRALAAHARWCRENVVELPAALSALQRELARAGQERPTVASVVLPPDDAPMTALTLDYRSVADRLGVSDRTVRRLVADGRLAAVDVAGCRRVRVEDLDGYVAGLAAS